MDPSVRPRRGSRPRGRARRILIAATLDVLLLPLAIAVVLLDDVLWRGARRLLRGLDRVRPVRAAHRWVAALPAMAVLPLFLVPEAVSHASGFLGAFLLAKGSVVAAVFLLILVKGVATLAVVWIYQAAAATLLSVGWFARMHHAVAFVRDWSLDQVAPLKNALRARFSRSPGLGAVIARRFRALRMRLVAMFRGLRMIL